MKVFGMVNTRDSAPYTPYALRSFFEHTPLEAGDRFFLIDNDHSCAENDYSKFSRLELIMNQQPLGFAENANQILRTAQESSADFFFLNNDIIFTPSWLEPLLSDRAAILSPLSNFNVPYKSETFECKRTMELSDFVGHEKDLAAICLQHKARLQGYKSVLTLPYFAVKIPHAVYSVVGEFDESFGRGGAEDNDYSIRAILAGFAIEYALPSYLLHFVGKSTWAGAETAEETARRDRNYLEKFEAKWGAPLSQLMIKNNLAVLDTAPELRARYEAGDFRGVIESLKTL